MKITAALGLVLLAAAAVVAQESTSTVAPECGAIENEIPLLPNAKFECDGSSCNMVCLPGFSLKPSPKVTYTCSNTFWVRGANQKDIVCSPVDCGVYPLEGTLKERLSSCAATTFGSTCTLRCGSGYDPRAAQTIVCNENGVWAGQDGSDVAVCRDQDGCASKPCQATVSVCEDIPAPRVGYVCRCAPGYIGDDTLIAATGRGCVRMAIDYENGDLVVKTGVGKSVTFQTGNKTETLSVIMDRISTAELQARDITTINSRMATLETNILSADTSLAARVATDATSISSSVASIESIRQSLVSLVGPTGQVNINKNNIADLQTRVSGILAAAGPIVAETSRATTAETSVATATTTLSSRVSTLDSKYQTTVTTVSALQSQIAAQTTFATGNEASLATSAAAISSRVNPIDSSLTSTLVKVGTVETGVTSIGTRQASISTAVASTNTRATTLDTNINAEISRAISQDTVLSTGVDEVRTFVTAFSCATPAAVSTFDGKYTAGEATNCANMAAVICSLNGFAYVPAFSTSKCARLGDHPAYAATSCTQIRDASAYGRLSGVYFILYNGVATRTYCDQTTDGGGWELIMKVNGNTNIMGYSSTYWTSTAVYRDTDLDPNLWEDAKYQGFNYGRYSGLRARWNDQGAILVWTEPGSWSNAQTPLAYFQVDRTISQNTGSSDSTHTGWMEWANMGGRFSDQICAKRRVTGQCSGSSNSLCVRWGLHYNNECDFSSNDVLNGLGMNINGRSAGDWIGCCTWRGGVNRGMGVMLWGRA